MKKLNLLVILLLSLCTTAFAGGPVLSPEIASDPPRSAPYSWEGPYIGGHAGKVWGTQRDNQSEVISDPECGLGEELIDGVCVPVVVTCIPGFILVDGVCVRDIGSIFCGVNEVPDPTTGECVCREGYIRDPISGQCRIPGFAAADKYDIRGFVAGLHAGRNWQRGSIVYGIEGDADIANIKGSADFLYAGGVAGTLSFRSDWQASLRVRVGYAMDRTLIYGTGGIAFGHAKLDGTSAGVAATDSNTHVGWTLGAGVERAFKSNWIGRIEARYTDFSNEDYDLGALGSNISSGWTQTTVTVGLSYKF